MELLLSKWLEDKEPLTTTISAPTWAAHDIPQMPFGPDMWVIEHRPDKDTAIFGHIIADDRGTNTLDLLKAGEEVEVELYVDEGGFAHVRPTES